MKGTHYLLLKNANKLSEKQTGVLQELLRNNDNLYLIYVIKEQLQALWNAESYEVMDEQLEQWCQVVDESEMHYLKTFAKSLRAHRKGICNYAKYKLTSAHPEIHNALKIKEINTI
jgi:transposase